MTPGPGVALTVSPYSEGTSGWYWGAQGGAIVAGQIGQSLGDGSFFWEAGAGSPGASLTVYHVSESFLKI